MTNNKSWVTQSCHFVVVVFSTGLHKLYLMAYANQKSINILKNKVNIKRKRDQQGKKL